MASEECKAFESCIQNFLQRQTRRLEKNHGISRDNLPPKHAKLCNQARRITKHSTHVLRTLYIKRKSLSHAIDAFDTIAQECVRIARLMMMKNTNVMNMNMNVKKNKDRKKYTPSTASSLLQDLLTHVFLQYIHIRDGFVLLTSGECRHRGDAQELLSPSHTFKSQLGGQGLGKGRGEARKRKDGYTSLFSSKCGYSGYGWDEFHNEEVGIRRRLLDTLRECCSYPSSRQRTQEEDMAFREGEAAAKAREKIWDKLLDMGGGQMFESAFDTHENEMKELQKRLEDKRARFMSDMERSLSSGAMMDIDMHTSGGRSSGTGAGVRLIMVTEDKFERLEVKNAGVIGLAAICIQRQGDAFKGKGSGTISDDGGALPSGATKEDWLQLMQLPSHLKETASLSDKEGTGKRERDATYGSSLKKKSSIDTGPKKKRLTIADSDEDGSDADEDGDEQPPNNGIKVTVKKTITRNERNSSSVASIKAQLGVNVDELQQAREDLENEEKGTKAAAYVDEFGEIFQSSSSYSKRQLHTQADVIQYSEEIFEINSDILEEEENVHMLKSICKRKNKQDDEAWDARESLRFSLMSLGNLYLECHTLLHLNTDYSLLTKALSCFENALATIKELGDLHENDRKMRSENDSGDTDGQFEYRYRALLLCRGRANTNIGKVYFEQYKMLSRKDRHANPRRVTNEETSKLMKAVKYLRSAERDARVLRTRAVTALNLSPSDPDLQAELHIVDANALESLTCRFQGYAFLNLSKETECIAAVEKASGIGNEAPVPISTPMRGGEEIIEARLGLLLEQYFGACSLVHIITSLLNLSMRENMSDRNSDETLSKILFQGYERAENISKALERFSQDSSIVVDIKGMIQQHEITSSYEICRLKESTRKFIKERSSQGKTRGQPTSVTLSDRSTICLPRNDLFRNSIPMPNIQSRTRVILDDGMSGQKRVDRNDSVTSGKQKTVVSVSDDAFDNFGSQTNENNETHTSYAFQDDETNRNIEYRKWGDELIDDPHQYPACEPKKPPEMIQELGLQE